MKDYSIYITLAYGISVLGLAVFLGFTWVQMKKSDVKGSPGEA